MIRLDAPWKSARIAAVDTETTGTDPRTERIIEIGIVIFEAGQVVDRYQALIHPERPLPPVITEVTGIKPEDLEGKPVFAEVAEEIRARLTGQVMLAYNAEFDIGMLKSEFERLGAPIDLPPCLDPFPFCWENLREKGLTRSAQLGTVSEYLKVTLTAAHRADHDAEAAGRVLYALDALVGFPETLQALLGVQAAAMQRVSEAFARFRRGKTPDRSALGAGEVVIELGPAYPYGDETDPVRALFSRIPDVRDRQAT